MMNGFPIAFADEARTFGRSYYLSYKLIEEKFTKEKFNSEFSDPAFEHIKSQTLYDLSVMSHISLYHFWEYQTQRLLRMLYRDSSICFSGISDLEQKLKDKKVEISIADAFPDLFELGLLCNTLKHGKGRSEKALRDRNSDIFIKQDPNIAFTPIISEQLVIGPVSYRKYLDAIAKFWKFIALYSTPPEQDPNE